MLRVSLLLLNIISLWLTFPDLSEVNAGKYLFPSISNAAVQMVTSHRALEYLCHLVYYKVPTQYIQLHLSFS